MGTKMEAAEPSQGGIATRGRSRLRKLWRLGVPEGRHAGPMRMRDRIKTVLSGAVIVGLAVGGGLVATAVPSQAATHGAGYDIGDGWIGQEMIGGVATYCLQITASPPTGNSYFDRNMAYPTMSALDNARVNMVVSTHGQKNNDNWASAVHLYVWSVADTAEYNSHGMSGDDYYIARVPSGQRADVRAKLAQIRSEAAGISAPATTGGGTGLFDFRVDGTNNYLGTLVVSLTPSNASGTVTLTNGIFDTGSNTMAGVTNGMVIPVRGVPPEDGSDYKISATGTFTGTTSGWVGEIGVYRTPGQQDTAGPGPSTVPTQFNVSGSDPTLRTPIFQPVVGTQVASKFVETGEEFVDTLNFSTVPDAAGLNNEWYRNRAGRYAPITAVGTLYGPSLYPFVESDAAPANVPVAATGITVSTTPEEGPTISYTGKSGVVSDEAGYYTWVWEIRAEDQATNVQRFLPADYHFTDRFGQVAETHITPSKLHISTELTKAEVGIGDGLTDEVTVALRDGGWLSESGSRVPVTLTGTAFYSETEPAMADNAPEGAEVIGTTKLTMDRQGTAESESVKMPMRAGYVTFQWCLVAADQPEEHRGKFTEVCDLYGLPLETAKIVAPVVTTQAKVEATRFDPIHDTAIVNGLVPENSVLEFSLYKKIVAGDAKRDADGNLTEELWTQEEVDALGDQAVCEAVNRVVPPDNGTSRIATTGRVPVNAGMNDAAEYDSPNVWVDANGTYWWVESLIHVDPETGTETVIHVGECGLPNETTTVKDPTVTTKATAEVMVGEDAFDTAVVEGSLPGNDSGLRTELTFEAFQKQGETPTCTAENRVFNLTEPVLVEEAGEFPSATVQFEKAGVYYWVETLTYVNSETGEKTIVHVGECGLPDETTKVKATPVIPFVPTTPAALAHTGVTIAPFAGIAVLLFVGAGVLFWVRSRRKAAASAE